ncbi:MAG: SDR family oxidoreductase, partial [Saprospiraceae bacterium]|nr:SDR family oxidoreductase [Saprospiraceae bacterium]
PIDSTFEDWSRAFEKTMAANLTGPAHLSFLAMQAFKNSGGGRLIHIGSRGAYRGEPSHPGYAASKAALHALSQSLAKAGGKHGIYSFALAPGFVSTDMAKPILDGPEGAEIMGQSPLGRVAKPEEVANAALYFASGKGDFSTGCVLDINGGSYLR